MKIRNEGPLVPDLWRDDNVTYKSSSVIIMISMICFDGWSLCLWYLVYLCLILRDWSLFVDILLNLFIYFFFLKIVLSVKSFDRSRLKLKWEGQLCEGKNNLFCTRI